MALNSLTTHNLQWEPGQTGKGFIVKPTDVGIKNFPNLEEAQPLVWTWPTEDMRPTHSQMGTKAIWNAPQGMKPVPSTYFHITPDGGIRQFGGGRTLSPDEQNTINNADPRLSPAEGPTPQIQTDGYGHANRLLEILGTIRKGRWIEWPRRWHKISGGDWFCPAYGIPDDVKEQIQEWGKSLPWDSSAKLQDPSKYHITSFYSPEGFSNPTNHEWLNTQGGLSYPAYTHSLDTFSSPDKGNLSPIVMRFHAPELSAHAEDLMDQAEQRGLPVSRFEGGHKPHITIGHNPAGFNAQPPHIEFNTTPIHELHSYYDSLR